MLYPNDYIENMPMQTLTCKAARFQVYQSEIIDGKIYIIGKGKAEDDKPTLFFDKCCRSDLLISLLTLYERLDTVLYGHFDERVRSADIARICDWCSRYGMPMEASTADENSIWMKYGKIGFLASAFYSQLHELYTCYLLWRRIELPYTDQGNFYAKTPVDECKSILGAHMDTVDMRLRPDFSQYPPTYSLECENYMAVAKAHMFFICMSCEFAFIGVCAVCGKPFTKTRKNNTLCEECQKTKSKRSRARKRVNAQSSDAQMDVSGDGAQLPCDSHNRGMSSKGKGAD